jgi:hypothetical protein
MFVFQELFLFIYNLIGIGAAKKFNPESESKPVVHKNYAASQQWLKYTTALVHLQCTVAGTILITLHKKQVCGCNFEFWSFKLM